VINRYSHNSWKWYAWSCGLCACIGPKYCAPSHLFVLFFSRSWSSCFGSHYHDVLKVFLFSFFHRFNLQWWSCSSLCLCAFAILMFDANIVHLFLFIVFTSPMCSTCFICLPTFVFSKLWCTMIVLFLFLCFHKSNVHQWFCSSSHLCAFKVLMCNSVFVHLLVMLSQFECAMVVLLVFLSSCFQSFKPQQWSCLSFCSTSCISPLPMPPAPPPPQTHKLLNKVSQAWRDMPCNLHSYCYFLLCILLLCIILIVEVHIVISQWVSLDTFLKLLTIIFDCNSRIQCLELCLLLVVNMILHYLFNYV
jgi:hypothetical protein